MPNEFPYDVFPSYSSKDKAVVRPLAERLRKDGLKVWFDEWVLKPGDQTSKPGSSRRESAQTSVRPDQRMSELTSAATREERIEDGLEHSKFGFRICAARHVGQCVRLGMGAVAADALSTINSQPSTNWRPAEPGAPLHSPAARRRLSTMF